MPTVLGHKFSNGEAVAIGAGGLVVIYFAVKQHQASAAAASSGSAIDPLTGLPTSQDNAIDPLTGQAYLAEAQQYGSVSAAEQALAAESSVDFGSSFGGGGGVVGTSSTPLVPSNEVQGTTYASNAAWAQAVEAGLVDIGYSSTDIAAALGRYLGNLSETPDQASIVGAATAEFGPPPVGSFQIILAPATTSTTSGNTGTGTSTDTGTATTTSTGTTTPAGSTTPATAQTSTVSGGHVVSANNNDVTVAWNHAGPATSWKCTLSFPGSEDGHTGTVTSPQASYSGLPAGHSGYVEVQPLPSGTPGKIEIATTK